MKRIIAAGRFDRRAQRSHVVVRQDDVIGHEWTVGQVKGGYVRALTREEKEQDGQAADRPEEA